MTSNPRIAWLSPFGPRSDIGAYTRCLLPHFADANEGAFDCDLFVNPNGETYDSPVPTMDLPASGTVGEILSRYDAAFFNLGNNWQNHTLIANALQGLPGIAILHDFSYHHFFAHKCFSELRSPPAYARLIREYYGSKGFNMALRSGIVTRDATLYAPWDGENVSDYPLFPAVANLAAALVVHSRFMEERVTPSFKGPVLRLFLPHDQKAAPSADDIGRWQRETALKERCQFSAFGHISRAKCLDVVIHAMSRSALLKARSNLVIAGMPGDKEYVREIEALVFKLGLTKQVAFEYDITDQRLLAIKQETDVFVNLRYPNTEGASGSLVEMMNSGRPVIAYRAGCYADMPDDAASLLDRNEGVEAVVAAMENLLTSPDLRVQIGAAGKNHLADKDSANYVRQIKKFVKDIQPDLRRRARFVVPARDGFRWTRGDVTEGDAEWFGELTRARRAMLALDCDRAAHSPETFLNWSMDDMVAFAARVLLHAPMQPRFSSMLADYAQRLGRWPFYRLISRLRFYQDLCEQSEISRPDVENFGERIPDVAFWDIATKLQPQTFTQLLYLSVLERGSTAGERESWIRRIRQGLQPSFVLLEFLTSPEYGQTFSDTLMSEVQEWARREFEVENGHRHQARSSIVWPVEAGIRFNDDTPMAEALLGKLWHRRDAQGRWSNGRIGDLHFLMPNAIAERGATLTLRLRLAGTRFTGHRRISAQCERRELVSVTVKNDTPLTLRIPLPASLYTKDSVTLLLLVDKDFSPASTAQSNDGRSLGVMLIEGTLTLGSDGVSVLSVA